MNLALWLHRTALLTPEAPALLSGTDPVADYRGFAAAARALAGRLAEAGVGPGDRVGLFAANEPAWLPALFGIWWAGAAAVPVNARLHGAEAGWILDHAEARLVLCSGAGATALEAAGSLVPRRIMTLEAGQGPDAPVPRDAGDLAWLFYTSGTTGRPKGVMLSHGNLVAMSLCYPLDVDPLSAADAALYAAPMSHGAGLYSMVHVRAGARHVVPLSQGVDPDEILDLAPRLGRVSMFAAPTIVNRIVHAAERRQKNGGETGEGLRTIVYGGGPMYLADIERAVSTMGPRFVQIYGQGESPMTITALPRHLVADRAHPRWRARLGSVGTAQSCVEIRVVGEDRAVLPPDEPGEVAVKGATVMAGYWRNPEATAATIRDGWLMTGDIGRIDADGFLTLTDRARDVVISGGSNIYPREVEEAALSHPGVAEIACVGRPDREWGEALVAFWVAAEGQDPDVADLDRHVTARLARFKRPKDWVRVEALPKNNYGKVLKTELRARLKG